MDMVPILSARADVRMVNAVTAANARKSAPAQPQTTGAAQLTDAAITQLVGHENVVYYNLDTNSWNTNTYNGYKIKYQNWDALAVKEFKATMEKIPEFSKNYEMVASIIMTINDKDFHDYGKFVSAPKYDSTGKAVVGNIIIRNKNTGKLELYCKDWLGVLKFYFPKDAVRTGAYWFAYYGARLPGFRAAMITAHNQKSM